MSSSTSPAASTTSPTTSKPPSTRRRTATPPAPDLPGPEEVAAARARLLTDLNAGVRELLGQVDALAAVVRLLRRRAFWWRVGVGALAAVVVAVAIVAWTAAATSRQNARTSAAICVNGNELRAVFSATIEQARALSHVDEPLPAHASATQRRQHVIALEFYNDARARLALVDCEHLDRPPGPDGTRLPSSSSSTAPGGRP